MTNQFFCYIEPYNSNIFLGSLPFPPSHYWDSSYNGLYDDVLKIMSVVMCTWQSYIVD
jgi:hypothetical protein